MDSTNRLAEPAVPERPAQASFTRRQVAAYGALLLGSLATGCTGFRMLTSAYPDRYDEDLELGDAALRAFVVTVIPSAPLDDENLTRVFGDAEFPFRRHRGYFVYDLCSRSRQLARTEFNTRDRGRQPGRGAGCPGAAGDRCARRRARTGDPVACQGPAHPREDGAGGPRAFPG